MYFIIRCVNEAGISTMKIIELEMMDLTPPSGIQLYDLPLGYNLDILTDLLRSENLGPETRILHDNDVEFTNSTTGMAGAVAGIYCSQYDWSLKVCLLTEY